MKNIKETKVVNFFYLGPPGSGKGTQAALLASFLKLKKIDCGGALRQLIKEKGYFAQKISKTMQAGELVPTWLVVNLWFDFLKNTNLNQGIITEGNPRTVLEAEILDDMLFWLGRKNLKVIYLKVRLSEAKKRMLLRRVCQKCNMPVSLYFNPEIKKCPRCQGKLVRRLDDKVSTINNRFKVFEKQVLPAVKYYRKKGNLIEISGEGSIDKIFQETLKKLNLKKK